MSTQTPTDVTLTTPDPIRTFLKLAEEGDEFALTLESNGGYTRTHRFEVAHRGEADSSLTYGPRLVSLKRYDSLEGERVAASHGFYVWDFDDVAGLYWQHNCGIEDGRPESPTEITLLHTDPTAEGHKDPEYELFPINGKPSESVEEAMNRLGDDVELGLREVESDPFSTE